MVNQLGQRFPPQDYPQLLVGLGQPDDAAVYQIDETRAIINTIDFFPPVVDDPYAFGAIAAANAMSDVYAMGGEVLFGLNLTAWPDDLDPAILTEILRGGADKMKEGGAVIAGGHTISDKEPKYGLAVSGMVHPERILSKGGLQPGDALILTKPLGIGVITTAIKRAQAEAAHAEAAIASMMRLNRGAAQAAQALHPLIHAATDITGFGLAGHAHEMAHLSGCGLHLEWAALPWLDGALDYGEAWVFSGGTERNIEYYAQWITWADHMADWQQRLVCDPQTSGGLLLAIAAGQAETLLDELAAHDSGGWRIGTAVAGEAGQIEVS